MIEKIFNPMVWDLGNVHENTRHNFEFIYLGDKTIRSVSASCGCATAKKDDKLVVGTINTNAASDFYDYKHLSKSVTVKFLDKTPDVVLKIVGKVYKKNVNLEALNQEDNVAETAR